MSALAVRAFPIGHEIKKRPDNSTLEVLGQLFLNGSFYSPIRNGDRPVLAGYHLEGAGIVLMAYSLIKFSAHQVNDRICLILECLLDTIVDHHAFPLTSVILVSQKYIKLKKKNVNAKYVTVLSYILSSG